MKSVRLTFMSRDKLFDTLEIRLYHRVGIRLEDELLFQGNKIGGELLKRIDELRGPE